MSGKVLYVDRDLLETDDRLVLTQLLGADQRRCSPVVNHLVLQEVSSPDCATSPLYSICTVMGLAGANMAATALSSSLGS